MKNVALLIAKIITLALLASGAVAQAQWRSSETIPIDRNSGDSVRHRDPQPDAAEARLIREDLPEVHIDWQLVHYDVDQFFRSLSFPSHDTGYAAGGASFYRTRDAGQHWTKLALPVSVFSCYFNTPRHGYATSGNTIYETFDEGETWQPQMTHTVNLSRMAFYNADTILCVGTREVARSVRPGEWQDVHLAGANQLTGCAYVGTLTFVVGWSQRYPELTKPEAAALYYSADFGNSWNAQHSAVPGDLSAVTSFGDSSLIAVGGGLGHERILLTTDAGRSWQQDSTSIASQFRAVGFEPSGRVGVAAGTTVVLTIDAGHTWRRVNEPTAALVLAIACIDDTTCIVAGDSGAIYLGHLTQAAAVSNEQEWTDVLMHGLQVYPNPSQSNFRIHYELNHSCVIALTLHSTNGEKIKIIQSDKVEGAGAQEHEIETGPLPAGDYFLSLSANGYLKAVSIQVRK